MSTFGKILTFLVLIAACVWAYFTVSLYATRTNWKARADNFEKAFKESEAQRQKEYAEFQVARGHLERLYDSQKVRGDDQELALADIAKASRTANAEYEKLENDYRNADVQARLQGTNLDATLAELADNRKRINFLEDERVKLVLLKEQADRARLNAENEKKLAESIRDENAKKIEVLTAQITELRLTGGSGTASVLRSIEKQPAPLPDNIRGTVTRDMVGEFVQISIGIDAGLEPGSRLDVFRTAGGDGKYLGTLVVTSTLEPKTAVAQFRPARPVPVGQLRPDELPRKGDTVGQVTANRSR
jgi:hypothetical protein